MVKKIFTALFTCIMLLCFVPSVSADTLDSGAVISQDSDYVPLYTTSPDSSLKEHPDTMMPQQSIFFYTQTTLLALIAGYLIVFKIRCIPKHESMHRRRKLNE